MDRNISLAGAALNFAGVLGFAAAMLFLPVGFSYFFSILIAWGLVLMLAGFARTSPAGRTIAATCALVFGGMYALCNTIVYFVQLSVVATTQLGAQAAALLDFQQFGMFFSLDLLGYGLMALSTFFAGLALAPTRREETVLRWLLLAHGAFAPPCFILPALGVFFNFYGRGKLGRHRFAGILVRLFFTGGPVVTAILCPPSASTCCPNRPINATNRRALYRHGG